MNGQVCTRLNQHKLLLNMVLCIYWNVDWNFFLTN
jgi:hypothetical protein